MKQYLVGGVVALALAAVVVVALLLFTGLRVTDQSATDEAKALLLEGTNQTQVPDVTGTPVPAARHTLNDAGLQARVVVRGPRSVGRAPLVQGQTPPPDRAANTGGTVTLYVKGE